MPAAPLGVVSISMVINGIIVELMCENTFLANLSLEFGTVYRQTLLVLSHNSRIEILWVMST